MSTDQILCTPWTPVDLVPMNATNPLTIYVTRCGIPTWFVSRIVRQSKLVSEHRQSQLAEVTATMTTVVSAKRPYHTKKPHIPNKGRGVEMVIFEAGLLTATKDQGEATEAEKGGGGGLRDGGCAYDVEFTVPGPVKSGITKVESHTIDAAAQQCSTVVFC